MAKKVSADSSEVSGIDHRDDNNRDHDEPVIRKVPAVTRAIAILRLLGRSDEPLGVNRIARALGLVPSTVLHILRVLMAEGFVKFDKQTKRYELDIGVLSVAHSVLQRNRFIQVLQSSLRRLADEFGFTMLAVKTIGLDHMAVVGTASSNLPIRLHAEIGARFPSLVSATGRCVAAFGDYKKSQLKQQFEKITWDKPMSFSQWWDLVQQAKRDGYALDDSNFMVGVSVIAVPIMAAGHMNYSIAGIGLREQLANLGIERVSTKMKEVAAELGNVLIQSQP